LGSLDNVTFTKFLGVCTQWHSTELFFSTVVLALVIEVMQGIGFQGYAGNWLLQNFFIE
jgi:hypothetical protein